MLPKKNRVTTEKFMTVVNNGTRVLSPHFSIVYQKNNQYFKGSVVISKKISKKAPTRNYQKRKAREAIKKVFYPTKDFRFSCVFFVKKSISELSLVQLTEEIREFSKKIK